MVSEKINSHSSTNDDSGIKNKEARRQSVGFEWRHLHLTLKSNARIKRYFSLTNRSVSPNIVTFILLIEITITLKLQSTKKKLYCPN